MDKNFVKAIVWGSVQRYLKVMLIALATLLIALIGYIWLVSANKNDEGMYSKNMILMRLDDHKIIEEHGSRQQIYPASLTKIMTAIVCLEACDDPLALVSLSEDNYERLIRQNASMAGFLPGEKVNVMDMFYGIILPSGADAAITLSEKYFGSEQNCVRIMNLKARDIGMNQTHFVNVTGLHDKNHYTTLKDLSKLMIYALNNDVFRRIFTTPVYETMPTKNHCEGIVLESTLFKRVSLETLNDITLLGGKTGFTDDAGLCLATLASCKNKEYILITAGAKGTNSESVFHILDAVHVYENLEEESEKSENDQYARSCS